MKVREAITFDDVLLVPAESSVRPNETKVHTMITKDVKLNIPLISIATLASLAAQVELKKEFVIPMLDARRMEVYSAVFDENLKEIRETKAEVLDENSFTDYLEKDKTVFIGNGVEKFKAICTHSNAEFILDKLPSAREMCSLAEAKYKISDTEDVAYFEPYYLKDFVVNRKD